MHLLPAVKILLKTCSKLSWKLSQNSLIISVGPKYSNFPIFNLKISYAQKYSSIMPLNVEVCKCYSSHSSLNITVVICKRREFRLQFLTG